MNDLKRALEEHTSGKSVSVSLTNPIGRNVKWECKDAHWMPSETCDASANRISNQSPKDTRHAQEIESIRIDVVVLLGIGS